MAAGGFEHSLWSESDGTVYAAGDNGDGELGTGSKGTGSDVPEAALITGAAQPLPSVLPEPPVTRPPVLLIHGVPGSSGQTGGDNGADWAALKNFLSSLGIATQTEGYYAADINMDDWLDYSDQPALCWGSDYYNDGNGPSNKPGDGEVEASPHGASHDGDADYRHLAFELARRISDLYGSSPVEIIADSGGGLIVRWMLYQLNNPTVPTLSNGAYDSCPYPSVLNVDNVITMDTPNNGANLAGAPGGLTDFETKEMVGNSESVPADFTWTLNHNGTGSGSGLNPQSSSGTQWTVMGSLSDGLVSWTSQLHMGGSGNPVHAVLFDSTTSNCFGDEQTYNAEGLSNPVFAGDPCTYGHGAMKQDTATTRDAQSEWDNGWTESGSGANWDTVPGDTGDPFANAGTGNPHAVQWIYGVLTT
jgi:hypothetical protein